MKTLADYPVANKWPPRFPERLQLYSLGTPNGLKVSIFLEEAGLPYEAHKVDFARNDQLSLQFLALNPNKKTSARVRATWARHGGCSRCSMPVSPIATG
jgi:GST-like protein